jgi:hypothetical protein
MQKTTDCSHPGVARLRIPKTSMVGEVLQLGASESRAVICSD